MNHLEFPSSMIGRNGHFLSLEANFVTLNMGTFHKNHIHLEQQILNVLSVAQLPTTNRHQWLVAIESVLSVHFNIFHPIQHEPSVLAIVNANMLFDWNFILHKVVFVDRMTLVNDRDAVDRLKDTIETHYLGWTKKMRLDMQDVIRLYTVAVREDDPFDYKFSLCH